MGGRRHCERSEAIQGPGTIGPVGALDCFAALAMTEAVVAMGYWFGRLEFYHPSEISTDSPPLVIAGLTRQ